MCGKNQNKSSRELITMGSPPRVREKLDSKTLDCTVSGITPACAGKTLTVSDYHKETRDHPRVCGKNTKCVCTQGLNPGSPPRVREKPADTSWEVLGRGITPACAGKTYSTSTIRNSKRDHPRVCGKNLMVRNA